MIVLNFEVIKQTVSQRNFEDLMNDSSNYVKLSFDFKDPDWSNIYKRILLHSRSSETYCKELDENHEVIVPWEVLTDDYFIFNLYGVKDNLRITTNQKKVSLGNSGYTDEIEKPLPPTPETIDDLYNKINEADSSIAVVDGKVDNTNETVSSISSDLNQTKTNVTNITTNLNGAIQDISTLENGLEQTNSNISTLDDRLDSVDTNITNITQKLNNTIEMEVTYIDDTQETFNLVVKENESN